MFVHFATRTTLLEAVNDWISKSFINALKRFIARRWRILNLHSDNGINSIVANNEIKNLFTEFWGPHFEQFIKFILNLQLLTSEPFINALKRFRAKRGRISITMEQILLWRTMKLRSCSLNFQVHILASLLSSFWSCKCPN